MPRKKKAEPPKPGAPRQASGGVGATPVWTTACPDWERRVVARESLIPFAPLFPEQAKAARIVFDSLRIVDAPGSPTTAEACRPWVFDFVDAVFGSYDHEAGRRLIREFFLCVSKKNSKSTIAAGIMLTALVRNWRNSGEYLILAPTIEVAQNSFIPARDMIKNHPTLADMFLIQEHYRTITHRTTKATLKVVAADDQAVGGKKAIGVLVDELWLFGQRPSAENMLREATGGLASRPEGFVIYLSTQSDQPPAGVFAQRLKYARGVRDGRIKDDRFLPIIYEYPKAMLDAGAHKDKATFYVTNPNLGASVDVEFLEREADKAVDAGAESLCGFFAKHLNVEIGLALASDRWAGADFWEAAAMPATLDEIVARSDAVTVGIDGGGLDDLLGLAVVGRERKTRRWLLWCHAWCHESVLQRHKQEAARLRDFEQQGDLTIVRDLGQDIAEVVDIVQLTDRSGKLYGVGLDPVGIGPIVDALAEIEVTGKRVVGIPQGWKLAGAIKTLERKLADKTLVHAGQGIMAWCVGNAKVEPRGNAITITKQGAGNAKIDPLMATFNAAALMSLNPEDTSSVYLDRGMLFV